MPKSPLQKKKYNCKVCGNEYEKFNSTQKVCSPKCALEYGRTASQKAAEKRLRKETREGREKLKTLSDWIAEAQKYFNKFIRLRDYDKPCISCGREKVEWTRGGAWDCGHFKTRGAFPELRFHEWNAHKQCKSCNGGSGKYARKSHTVAQEYEKRLIERIGKEKVDWLNGPHEQANWTIDDIKQIKAKYAKKARELEKSLRLSI